MRSTELTRWLPISVCMVFVMLHTAVVAQQQVTIGTPLRGVSSGFSENIGVNFGFNIRGGNPNGTGSRVVGLAPGGGGFALNPFTPNGDLQFRQGPRGAPGDAAAGVAVLGGGGGAFFGINASQSSTRTTTSQTPMVTTLNGHPGIFSDTLQRPFVISTIPVVGGAPLLGGIPQAPQPQLPSSISPLRQRMARLAAEQESASVRLTAPAAGQADRADGFARKVARARQSSAGRPAASVAAIRAQHDAQDRANAAAADAELQTLIERADAAVAADRHGAAKVYLQMAARRATGDLRTRLLHRLDELSPR